MPLEMNDDDELMMVNQPTPGNVPVAERRQCLANRPAILWSAAAEGIPSAAEVGSSMTPVEPHKTRRSFANSDETAPNLRQTTQTERRRAGNPRPALRLDPYLEHKPPISRSRPVNFFIC